MSETPKVEGHATASAEIVVGTAEQPNVVVEPAQAQPPPARHLTVEKYEDSQRVEAPDWYDDTINVGDEANKDAES